MGVSNFDSVGDCLLDFTLGSWSWWRSRETRQNEGTEIRCLGLYRDSHCHVPGKRNTLGDENENQRETVAMNVIRVYSPRPTAGILAPVLSLKEVGAMFDVCGMGWDGVDYSCR